MHSLRAGFAVAALCVAASSALADAIDGTWCSGPRQLTIDGPRIVTPEGQNLEGLYRRHSFAYQNPAGSADAGAVMVFQLLTDDEMISSKADDPPEAKPETWKRCEITS